MWEGADVGRPADGVLHSVNMYFYTSEASQSLDFLSLPALPVAFPHLSKYLIYPMARPKILGSVLASLLISHPISDPPAANHVGYI